MAYSRRITQETSIILTHDEYARLVHKMVERNKRIGNRYEFQQESISFTSWMDYFILGNLYLVGLSMDFSEFDLWWLLNRRKRENITCGKIYYYKSKNDKLEIIRALDKFGVKIIAFNIEGSDNDDYYKKFYSCVKDHIEQTLVKKGTHHEKNS